MLIYMAVIYFTHAEESMKCNNLMLVDRFHIQMLTGKMYKGVHVTGKPAPV